MKYSFTCPLENCKQTMITEAKDSDEAADKLTAVAREHLALAHPDIKKTDQEVHNDIESQMTNP